MINFYDTSALLEIKNNQYEEPFVISSITLDELNDIKDNRNKTPEVRAQARKVINYLDTHEGEYDVILYKPEMLKDNLYDLEVTNDLKILVSAYDTLNKEDDIIFWCNDGGFRRIAKEYDFFKEIKPYRAPKQEEYKGYVELVLNDDQLNTLYSDKSVNSLGLLTNEYAIIKTEDGTITDRLCWDGKRYRNISYSAFESQYMGEITPIHGDVYQQLASDALLHDQLVMLSGKAGTGKTLLGLGYAMSELEAKRKSRIVILCNPAPARDAIQLGWYAGTREDKVLDSSMGTILASKFKGGMDDVQSLIHMGKIEIVPMVDARGMDLRDQDAILYITEAQNMSKYLMQIALQRAAENTQVIIEGDYDTQVDLDAYDNGNNGMRRLNEVFRGRKVFGMVDLPIIHRSKIAELADKF